MYKESVIWYITFTHSQGHQEMVTIQLLPFLLYVNMALKNLTWVEFGSQISFLDKNLAKVYIYIEGGKYEN